jgi:hypothetical protein
VYEREVGKLRPTLKSVFLRNSLGELILCVKRHILTAWSLEAVWGENSETFLEGVR